MAIAAKLETLGNVPMVSAAMALMQTAMVFIAVAILFRVARHVRGAEA